MTSTCFQRLFGYLSKNRQIIIQCICLFLLILLAHEMSFQDEMNGLDIRRSMSPKLGTVNQAENSLMNPAIQSVPFANASPGTTFSAL